MWPAEPYDTSLGPSGTLFFSSQSRLISEPAVMKELSETCMHAYAAGAWSGVETDLASLNE